MIQPHYTLRRYHWVNLEFDALDANQYLQGRYILYQPPKCAALEIEVTTTYLDIFLVQINAVDIQRKLIKLASHFFYPTNEQTNTAWKYRKRSQKGAREQTISSLKRGIGRFYYFGCPRSTKSTTKLSNIGSRRGVTKPRIGFLT